MSNNQTKKYKISWSDSYANEFFFIKKVDNELDKAFCIICNSKFNISNGGRAQITKHAETNKHKAGIEASTSSHNIQRFFRSMTSSEDLQTLAKEGTFAYHTARHNISFKSNDCSSSLINKMFDSKFTLAQTKVSAIIRNVIHPMIDKNRSDEFKEMNFLSVITDTSNRLNLKMLPVVVRGFNPAVGVRHMLLSLISIPNEKSETVTKELLIIAEKRNMMEKIVCYGADNTNLNFGGVARQGQENVWRKLQTRLERKILGIGCGAHITHNAAKHGCQMLKINFESLAVNIYNHFKIHAVRTEALRTVCDELEYVFMPIKSHSGTRFLSLNPALNRIINMFEPLSEYFLSLSQCPPTIRSFFENKTTKFWLVFVEHQSKIFNTSIEKMEKTATPSFEAAEELRMLKSKIQNRKLLNYLPHEAEVEKLKLNDNDQQTIKLELTKFYDAIIYYIDLWEKSYDGSEVFNWVSMYQFPKWDIVVQSFEFGVSRFGEDFRKIINRDQLCDEFGLIKDFCTKSFSKWNSNNTPCDKIWVEIFQEFQSQSLQLVNLEKLVEFALCLPGTSTEVERIFSLIKNIWGDGRGSLLLPTVESMLSIQYNSDLSCMDFYLTIKKSNSMLEKIQSSDKYK